MKLLGGAKFLFFLYIMFKMKFFGHNKTWREQKNLWATGTKNL